MFIKVMYPDGTMGSEKSSTLGSLIKSGKVVAYKCSEGWVEVRRKREMLSRTPERRVAGLF